MLTQDAHKFEMGQNSPTGDQLASAFDLCVLKTHGNIQRLADELKPARDVANLRQAREPVARGRRAGLSEELEPICG